MVVEMLYRCRHGGSLSQPRLDPKIKLKEEIVDNPHTTLARNNHHEYSPL